MSFSSQHSPLQSSPELLSVQWLNLPYHVILEVAPSYTVLKTLKSSSRWDISFSRSDEIIR